MRISDWSSDVCSSDLIPDPRERLRNLFQLVAHEAKSHVIYSALLKALDHPAVQPVMERVSERRLEYLTASFRQAGLGRSDAQHRARLARSEEHTSELQSLMRISYAVFCLKKKNTYKIYIKHDEVK